MILSRISWGSLAAGPGVLGVSRDAPPERIPRIVDGARYQTRLARNLIAVIDITQSFKTWTPTQWIVEVPDNEDAGTFFDDIEVVVSGGAAPPACSPCSGWLNTCKQTNPSEEGWRSCPPGLITRCHSFLRLCIKQSSITARAPLDPTSETSRVSPVPRSITNSISRVHLAYQEPGSVPSPTYTSPPMTEDIIPAYLYLFP